MKITAICLSATLLAGMNGARAADTLESGLAVGEKAGPFQVQDITGPSAGKTLCYR